MDKEKCGPIPISAEAVQEAKEKAFKAIKKKYKKAHEKRSLLGGEVEEGDEDEERGKKLKGKKDPWAKWMKEDHKKLDIHTFTNEMSATGSKVNENQFLAVNIYFPKTKLTKEFRNTKFRDDAKGLLANFKDFKSYCSSQ